MQGLPAPVDILRTPVAKGDGSGAQPAQRSGASAATAGSDFAGIMALLGAPRTASPSSVAPTQLPEGKVAAGDADAEPEPTGELIAGTPTLLIQGAFTLPPDSESALVSEAAMTEGATEEATVNTVPQTTMTTPSGPQLRLADSIAAAPSPTLVGHAEQVDVGTAAEEPHTAVADEAPVSPAGSGPRTADSSQTLPSTPRQPNAVVSAGTADEVSATRVTPLQTSPKQPTPVVPAEAIPPGSGPSPVHQQSEPNSSGGISEVMGSAQRLGQQQAATPMAGDPAKLAATPVQPSDTRILPTQDQQRQPVAVPMAPASGASTDSVGPPSTVMRHAEPGGVEPAISTHQPHFVLPTAQPIHLENGSLGTTANIAGAAAIPAAAANPAAAVNPAVTNPTRAVKSVPAAVSTAAGATVPRVATTAPLRPTVGTTAAQQSTAAYRHVARDLSPERANAGPVVSVASIEWDPLQGTSAEPSSPSDQAVTSGSQGASNSGIAATSASWNPVAMGSLTMPGNHATLSMMDVPLMRSDFVSQTVALVQNTPHGEEQRVIMRLDPPELGRVLVRIRRNSDRLSVRIESDSGRTLSVLREQHTQLVDSLASGMSNSGHVDLSYSDGQTPNESLTEEQTFRLTGFDIAPEPGTASESVPRRGELNFVA